MLRAIEGGKNLRQVSAEEIMTKDAVTVTEEMLIKDLINLFQKRHLIRALAIRGKILVGIASRRDAGFGYVKATAKYWWPGKGWRVTAEFPEWSHQYSVEEVKRVRREWRLTVGSV